jgi:uncharacterized membrane protein
MNTFDGKTYDEKRDKARLSTQLQRVLDVMRHGTSLTLSNIAAIVDAPESSVSARLRDLRKPKFGGHIITKRNIGGGTFIYRLDPQPSNQTESKS